MKKNKNITLIGMAGSGKTYSGKRLAKKLNCGFIDVDGLIEKKMSLKIQEVLDKLGEKKFKEIEEKIILSLKNIENSVISPGGSIIYSNKAMNFLSKNSIVVFINVPFDTINKRLNDQENRAIIGLKRKTLKQIYEERFPLYVEYADIIISGEDNVLEKLMNKLKKYGNIY
jgi:shikimate kinase